jgi:hypothetical protein
MTSEKDETVEAYLVCYREGHVPSGRFALNTFQTSNIIQICERCGAGFIEKKKDTRSNPGV